MILGQSLQRLVKRRTHGRNLCVFFRRQIVEVFIRSFTRMNLIHDAVKACHQKGREAKVGIGHRIGETFRVGDIAVTLTPALHNWQNGAPEYAYRQWAPEDGCGYRLDTPDGSVWLPGDSKLLPEQLCQPAPDVILFDFSDNDWHITFDGAVRLANAYPEAALVCIHWGTVDAPGMSPFNGDPNRLPGRVVNPERVKAVLPGEAVRLTK